MLPTGRPCTGSPTLQGCFASVPALAGRLAPSLRLAHVSSCTLLRRPPLSISNAHFRRKSLVVQASAAAQAADNHREPGAATSAPNPFLTVVLPTAIALMVCNMDRICMSVAILPMSQEFGWSASLQGIIQSAFLWGYVASTLLGGALADKYGGKIVMAGGILWFSLASLLLPAALSPAFVAAGLTLPLVLAARVFVGLGEGVALPCMNNLVALSVPREAKARGLGMCFSGFHAGNLVGLLLSPVLLAQCGWRGLFSVFGLLGGPLLLFWLKVLPDKVSAATSSSGSATSATAAAAAGADLPSSPTASTSGSSASSASSSLPSLGAFDLMKSSATWAIIVVNIVNHWGYFIYLNWMPTYFNKVLGFDLRGSSFTALLPWVVMAIGSSAAGLLADKLVASGVPVTKVRKALQSVAFLVPAVSLIILSQPGISSTAAVACLTVALGTTSLGQAGFVANMSDIAPRHAGKMFGLCNTFGSLSAILGVTAVGFIVEKTNSFNPVFQLTACMYVAATIFWNVFCTGEKVFD